MRHAEQLPNFQPLTRPEQPKVTPCGHPVEDMGLEIAKYTLGK